MNASFVPPGRAKIDVEKNGPRTTPDEAFQSGAGLSRATREAPVIENEAWGELGNQLFVDGVVGAISNDVEFRFSADQGHFDRSGSQVLVDLHCGKVHPPLLHRSQDSPPEPVIANSTDQDWSRVKSLEIPRHVERSPAQDLATIRETVKEHFSEDHDPLDGLGIGQRTQSDVSGRKCTRPSKMPAA